MSHRLSPPRRVAALLSVALLSALVLAASARAAETPWGELERFGERGTHLGQLEKPEYAFGIDQSDGGLWVVDQASEGTKFRIQKFMKSGGKYKAVASATFKPEDPGGEEEDEVEGVAFDPSLKRAYVLVEESRPAPKKGGKIIDQEDDAAAELYAFSTVPVETNKIAFAEGTTEGVLAGLEQLQPLSPEPGVSLIEPGGIAVDPTTHDVVITGWIDRGKKQPAEEQTTAIERVSSAGKVVKRWVDETNFFEECDCENSPVVTSSGHIYVLGGPEEGDELVEIPAMLEGVPHAVFAFDCETCTFNEPLTSFPGNASEHGSQMSIGPEGNFYVHARVELASEENFKHGGVLVLSPTFQEIGWTGGNTQASETQACSINESAAATGAITAGSSEQTVYAIARTAATPKITGFGSGGTGCPKGTATVPTAKSGGVEVEPIPIADKVTFSSKVTQANALSTEWEFGDGSPVQTTGRQQQTTEVQHTFKKGGHLVVTEKIHSDDLATPVIEVKRNVKIVAAPTIGSEEAEVKPDGLTVVMKGTVNPNGKKTECKFEYGKATEGYPLSLPCTPEPGAGETAKEVSATITSGLAKHTEYHFRIFAKNEEGEGTGKGATFTTGPPPLVLAEPASSISFTSATLNGKVNPQGASTECRFEYGTTVSYGSSVPCPVSPGSGEAAVAESVAVNGLKAGTSYHFRLVAKSGGKTVLGEDKAFATNTESTPPSNTTTTPPPPPPPTGGVLNEQTIHGQPIVTIATSSIPVAANGSFPLKLSCPANAAGCTGSVTLKTLTAVSARAHAAKKSILTLSAGSFALGGGQAKTITLHLSAKARKLLARTHSVRARVTILAHDPAGVAHTTTGVITLRAPKAHHH